MDQKDRIIRTKSSKVSSWNTISASSPDACLPLPRCDYQWARLLSLSLSYIHTPILISEYLPDLFVHTHSNCEATVQLVNPIRLAISGQQRSVPNTKHKDRHAVSIRSVHFELEQQLLSAGQNKGICGESASLQELYLLYTSHHWIAADFFFFCRT